MSLLRKGRLPVAAVVAATSVVLVFALGAPSASARKSSAKPRTETQFTVFDHTFASQRTSSGGFVFRDVLTEPNDRDDVVGHLRGVGTGCGQGCFEIKALVHIFDEGYLKVRGKFLRNRPSRQNNRLIIVGGSGAYNGAAGKVRVHGLGGSNSLLTFDFVQ